MSVSAEPPWSPPSSQLCSRLPFWALYKFISVLSKAGSVNSLTGNPISCIQGGLYSLPQRFTGWVTTYCFLTARQLNLQSELIKFLHLQTAAVSLAPWCDTVLVCTTQLVLFSLRLLAAAWKGKSLSAALSSLIRETSPSYQLLWFWLIAALFPADVLRCSLLAVLAAWTLCFGKHLSIFPRTDFLCLCRRCSSFIFLLIDFTACPPFCLGNSYGHVICSCWKFLPL